MKKKVKKIKKKVIDREMITIAKLDMRFFPYAFMRIAVMGGVAHIQVSNDNKCWIDYE